VRLVAVIPLQVLLTLPRVRLRAPRFSTVTPVPLRATVFNRCLQIWLKQRKDELITLNWTLETVKQLVNALGIQLEDVLTWNIDSLKNVADKLMLSFNDVLNSQRVITRIRYLMATEPNQPLWTSGR